MNCPECDHRTEVGDSEYNDLFVHVWRNHREERSRNTAGYWKSLFPCPWCGVFEPKWEFENAVARNNLRRKHLQGCLQYAATCLAGVRIQ